MVLRAAYLLVAAVFLAHWSTISQHMIDIPYADDWRALRPGPHLLPAHFDLAWIFRSSNSTLYATNKFLDYLYFTHTSGNYSFHQQITSFVVLGGCVLLSIRLLARLHLPLPWQVLGVLSTIYFLQVGSYWGIASLAYQQALPVLGTLAILTLVSAPRVRAWHGPLLALLVCASGLAYISGAVAMTVLGASLLGMVFVFGKQGRIPGLGTNATIVLLFGAGCLLAQWWLVEPHPFGGIVYAMPLDWQFWHFWVHQVARALGDFSTDSSSWVRGAVFALFVFGLTGVSIARSALQIRAGATRNWKFVVVAGGVLVVVASYLAVVSYARGHYPHVATAPAEAAEAAKARFHFWWVAALVPWATTAPYFLLRGSDASSPSRPTAWRRWALPAVIAAALIGIQSPPQWDFGSYYARDAQQRRAGLRCLLQAFPKDGPIHCGDLLWGKWKKLNLRPLLLVARVRSLSFSYMFELSASQQQSMTALKRQLQSR